jgi:Uma2 family endonuclease
MLSVESLDPYGWGDRPLPGQDELPCSDGEPMETEFHGAQNEVLLSSLFDAWAERRDFYVASNMFVYFSQLQIKSNDFRGPDVFVVLDVEAKPRKSWVAWSEGGRLPDVVIEVTSMSTAHVDRGEKMRIYSQVWHTGAYFIFDPDTEQLEGYRLDNTGRRYVALEPDERGDYDVAAMGLKLGLRQTQYRFQQRRFVRWIAPDGKPLPLAAERVEAERQRADALEAELRALRTK